MNGEDKLRKEEELEEIRENIHDRFPDIKWPEPVMEPIFFGRLTKTEIKHKKAIMDVNTGFVWDVVSNAYGLLPHEKVLHDILSGIPEELGEPEVDIKIWDNGAKFRANVAFPDIKREEEIKVGDKIRPRLVAQSSYDRSLLHLIEGGAEQLVCGNGLVIFKPDGKSSRKHLNGASITPEFLAKFAETFLIDYSIATDRWRKWAEMQLTRDSLMEAFEELPFSEAERDKILMLPLMNHDNKFLQELPNPTLWDLNSAATQFARHEVRGETRKNSLDFDIAAAMSKLGGH